MVRATRGFRTRSREKLTQKSRAKFKSETYLKQFMENDMVVIAIEPSSHKGMPFPKLKGRIGKITEKRGNSYAVSVDIGKSKKTLIARPEHLKLAK